MFTNRLYSFFGHIQQQFQPKLLNNKITIGSLNQRLKLLSTTTESKYRYSFTNGANDKISNEQRDFYEENGYILIKKLLSDNDIERYWQRFQDLATGKVEPNPLLLLQRELATAKQAIHERNLYKVQELYADDVLFEYCRHPLVLDIVEAFTGGPNILAIHSMLINKPPDAGTKSSRHPLHQDLHYFPMRPADRIVGTWTAMEKITKENGCLSAIPGTHKGEHLEHDYPEWEGGVNKLYYGIKDMKNVVGDRIHIEMERGDCLFFHPLLIHGSGMNRTKGFRKAISCHFASSTDCHYIEIKGTIQEKLAQEILDVYHRRARSFMGGDSDNMTYKDLWRNRSRLVRGEDKIGATTS
uniref:phytanoyl-CoA dioxygenase n=1 Tax=Dermatophagoides pteronyssinus TaxID=6956 RepID=A0A6P6YH63_DERPT|nr:probable phytanoyl-CoA dioxygenase [Dermatophagoides pteronyssinus]